MRQTARVLVAAAALALALAVGGCGGDGDESADDVPTITAPAPPKPTVLAATLTGAAARPKGPATGRGTARITIELRRNRACWRLTVSGTDKPISAHIHTGRPGEGGAVVIPLGDRFARRGCVLSTGKALREVLDSPRSYYVNVHTNRFLAGAVRGTLRTVSS